MLQTSELSDTSALRLILKPGQRHEFEFDLYFFKCTYMPNIKVLAQTVQN